MNSSLYGYTSHKCGHKQNWFESATLMNGLIVLLYKFNRKERKIKYLSKSCYFLIGGRQLGGSAWAESSNLSRMKSRPGWMGHSLDLCVAGGC